MAVINSDLIQASNPTTTAPFLTSPAQQGGSARFTTAINNSAAASHTTSDQIRICRLPSNAIVHEIARQTIGHTSMAADIGLRQLGTATALGAVISGTGVITTPAQCFGSAVALASTTGMTAYNLNESAAVALHLQFLPLWQMLGFAEDPAEIWELVYTITTSGTAGGANSIVTRVCYTNM